MKRKKVELYDMSDLFALAAENDHRIELRGDVWLSHIRDGHYLLREGYQGKNILPTEGLNHVLDVICHGSSQVTTWYCGIFKGNYTPIATDTAADNLGAGGDFTECQDADYDDPATNRPAYTEAAAAAGVITNSANPASFTIAASITVYGAFLASSQAKTAASGTLLAAKKFDASRAVIDNDVLLITYQITATSS